MINFKQIWEGLRIKPKATSTADSKGELEVDSSSGRLSYHDGSTLDEVVTAGSTDTLTNKTISGASNTINNVPAANIVNTPAGNLAATDVQAALNELQSDIDTRALDSDLTNHINDTSGAHAASAISNTPSGNLAATDVQAALNELQSDVDTRALDSALTNHISDTTTHGTTGDIVGTSDSQILTNKTIDADLNTISNIEDADIKSGANIARNKMASGTANHVVINDASGVFSSEATLAQSRGGTGFGTYTTGDILYASATDTLSKLGIGANGTVLSSNGTTVSWSTASISGATTTVTAGENLTANDIVYICSTTSDASRTVGRAYKQDITNTLRAVRAGVVTSTVTSGNTATIQLNGALSGFTGLPTGLPVYGSSSTPGSWQSSVPTGGGQYVDYLGIALSSTVLLINGDEAANIYRNTASNAGYTGGGRNSGGTVQNTINKLNFTTDALSTTSDTMSAAMSQVAGVSAQTKGYWAGGYNGSGAVTTGQSFTFATETRSTLASSLPASKYNMAGVQSSTDGFFGGNNDTTTAIYKITFSSETFSTSSATLSAARDQTAGFSSSDAGYIAGGTNGGTPQTTINKLVYGTETSSALGTGLPAARYFMQGIQTTTKGYWLGGYNSASQTNIYSMPFATDSTSTLSATLSQAKSKGGMVSSSNAGYAVGGENGSGTTVTQVEKFLFATDTSASNGASLGTATSLIGNGIQY